MLESKLKVGFKLKCAVAVVVVEMLMSSCFTTSHTLYIMHLATLTAGSLLLPTLETLITEVKQEMLSGNILTFQ